MKPDVTPLSDDELDQLEALLAELAERSEAVPDLEQLDGLLAAIACGPRPRPPAEALPQVLGAPLPFADDAQRDTVMGLVERRWQDVLRAVDAPVQRLDDERALNPLLTDWQSVLEQMPEAERASLGEVPGLGAVWASGFLQAVDACEDEWLLPADDEGNEFVDACLQTFEVLASEDAELPPEVREMSRDERLADALWAVYDLRDFWRDRASRRPVATVRKAPEPGRNDPCPCGSGKKYKKCHGDPSRQG
ncbi:UPF0149 family protein [Caldimonas thermodepolymerans]|jgi:yecA family protein|nr:YecA family protein [Caldimonas thermodepolymerans]QPC31718.1 UPF0149 family protein [Caldimonas thermodepolymerans]RDI01780.1 uncharacterized protein DES46_103343 [Caldimonas thermodepolymerans]TCP05917.1 uncharacterized protein EV676_108150 [Caldimonas thermodepolymerans]UZG44503.1 UPF0149 family protein [Caldimonas thermodepolymerans]UZG48146.1 UPF0149 family protein [Caldimonas thermodepolymerans]